MKKVMFFARDPGGANEIRPVYEKMKEKYQTLLYAKEFAFERFQDENLPVKELGTCGGETYEDILAFLKEMNPDAVITGTSLDDFTERYLWKAAETLHIKAFAILDQWVNLGIRFSGCDYSRAEEYHRRREHPYLPYRILAMDELAKEQLLKDGVSEDKIALTGQPHFDMVRDQFRRARQVYDRMRWNVVFVSEPLHQDYDNNSEAESYWGFNEKSIFGSLYRSLEYLAEANACKIRLIIRPHPRENRKGWEQVIKEMGKDSVTLEMDTVNDSFSVIKSADLVCGMSSMFLLESIICGRSVVSIEIGLKRENPFILDRTGHCRSILSEEELQKKLLQVYSSSEDENAKIPRGGVLENIIGYPKGICNATEEVVRLVEEEMER